MSVPPKSEQSAPVIEDAVLVEAEPSLLVQEVTEMLNHVAKVAKVEPLELLSTITKGKLKTMELLVKSNDKVLVRVKELLHAEFKTITATAETQED